MPALRPLHLGLTGNIASGKSTVARQLEQLGATVIDADTLAREAVEPGTAGYEAVIAHFGPGVVQPNGALDRAELRRVVFNDPLERRALNAIIHPEVGRLRETALAEAAERGDAVVISDIPLLFEVGLEPLFDGVILVDAPVAVRRARLIGDRGLPSAEADAMIAAQWPSEKKRAAATWVIDNDGSRAQLEARVAALWDTILILVDGRRAPAPSAS